MSQVDLSGQPVSNTSRCFQAGFPASRSLVPGSDEARQTTATSGRKCLEWCQSSGPLGCLERMLLGSSAWDSTLRLLTWKVQVTLSGRSYFRLVPSVPGTKDNGVSLLPTQDTMPEAPNKNCNRKYPKNLLQAAQDGYLPTPTAPRPHDSDNTAGKCYVRKRRDLANVAIRSFPTPTSRDHKDTGNLENVPENGLLGRVVRPSKESGSLNPQWVEWLIGFPSEWTALSASEMPLSRSRSTRSSKQSRKSKGVAAE